MLEFIVLGLVPGTHLQITLNWLVVLVLMLLVLLISFLAADIFWLKSRLAQSSNQLDISALTRVGLIINRVKYFLHKAAALRV